MDIAASTPSLLALASNAALTSLTSIADSAVREKLRHVDDEKADEQLECLVQACNARERQVLTCVVGTLAKVQVSVKNGAETELQKAKDMPWQTRPLKRVAEDPFCIVTRSVAPAMSMRELAGVAVMAAGASTRRTSTSADQLMHGGGARAIVAASRLVAWGGQLRPSSRWSGSMGARPARAAAAAEAEPRREGCP